MNPLKLIFTNRKSHFIISLLLTILSVNAVAQDTWNSSEYAASVAAKELQAKRIIPPAPEAAELGKYGNIPISLFTGSPYISVPIYEISGSRLKLPISMSYNSSGLKPQEMAGWIGLAWSLNAGGVITRTVAGNPDVQFNYFTTPNYLTALPADQTDKYAMYDYMKLLENGTYESSPDTYFYNFAGHTGKFFINPDQSIIKKEKNNLKITTPCFTCQPVSGIFTIIDEQGTIYEFTDIEQASTALDDGSDNYLVTHSYNYISSWYLTKITSPDGLESLTFDYTSPSNPHTMFRNFVSSGSVTYSRTSTDNSASWVQQGPVTSTPPIVSTTRKYLQAITYRKANAIICKVLFETTPDQRQDLDHNDFPGELLLNDIKVYNYIVPGSVHGIALVKQFNLNYSYFGDPSATYYYNKRLRLDNIQEINTVGGANKPPYSFTYNNASVASYTQGSIDHWGYSNGGEITNLVPTITTPSGEHFGLNAGREADLSSTSNTVMTQITYPTGGYTKFVYELNDALDDKGILQAVGGLRISQTSDYAFSNQKAVTKNYTYKKNDGTSSGRTFFPQYMSTSSYHYDPPQGYASNYNPPYDIGYVTITASSISGLGSFHGGHIGYTQVMTSQSDINTGKPLGKTISVFNAGSFGNDESVSSGDLIDLQQYDKDNNLLEEQINTYDYGTISAAVSYAVHPLPKQDNLLTLCRFVQNGSNFYQWEHGNESSPVCQEQRVYKSKTTYFGTAYLGQYKNLIDQVDKKFDISTGTFVAEEKKFTYGNPAYTYPTHIEERTGDTEWLINDTKYAGDYTIGGSQDAQSAAIALLQSKNMVSTDIESSQYLTTGGGTPRYTAGVLNFYSSSQPYLQQISRLVMLQPLSSVPQSDASTDTFTYDSHYKPWGSFAYDTYGNIIEQSRTGAIPTSYIWDYSATLPVAEVKGAASADIAYTSFETRSNGGWSVPAGNVATGALTGDVSYSLPSGQSISRYGLTAANQYVVSYWSKNGALGVATNAGSVSGSASLLPHNGWVFYQHMLPAGSTSVSLSASSTANIDELRLFPRSAQMSTTAYTPLVGLSSGSTPNNTILNYQYDGLNRLATITDLDGSIVKSFVYNYGTAIAAPTAAPQTLFFNAVQQSTYTKNNGCPSGASPGTAVYTVPYGRYVSSVSQADADNKATTDINTNGQNYANTTAQCFYYNAAINHQRIFQTNCTTAQGGANGAYFYTVAAGVFSSTISQADADAQAQADGQAQANARPCACGGEGQKVVNGSCETGTRHNSNSVLQSNGTYLCTYYYQFSDGSVSTNYTSISSSPCPIQ